MSTTEVYGWDELSASSPADVPYRVNILAGQIDADLDAVDTKATAAGTKNAAQDVRLGDLESWNTDLQNWQDEAPDVFVQLSRLTLPDGTDLNALTGPGDVGSYGYSVSSTYPGAPAVPVTSTAVFEVARGAANAVVQRLTFGNVFLWREVIDAAAKTWSAWEQAETKAASATKNAAQDTKLADHEAWLTDLNTADEQAVSRLEDIEALNTAQGTTLAAAVTKNAVQDGRLDTLEGTAARKTDPGMPVVGDDLPAYADATLDLTGRMAEATLADGTRYFPSVQSDVAKLAGATYTTADGNNYADATVDLAGRVAEAVLSDGTRYFPRLAVDSLTIGATTDTAPINVAIMAGQSNMAYEWYDGTVPALHTADSRLMVWGAIEQAMLPVVTGHPDDVPKGIARAMRRARPDQAVLIVPMAVGGTGFTGTSLASPPAGYHTNTNGAGTWDRALTADPLNLVPVMINNAKAAIAAAGARLGTVTFWWIQGESDAAYMTQAQYQTALDDLFAYVRAQLALPNMPIVVGGLVPERIDAYSAGEKGVVKAHIDTPRRLTCTAYQPGPRDYSKYGELVHYSKPGWTLHGQGMFSALQRAMLNVTTGAPIMPHNLIVKRLVDTVTVTWDAPPCRATAYNLETSTDSGATWTAQTLADGPLGLSHTITVPAATRVSARISTTNEVGTSITTKVDA